MILPWARQASSDLRLLASLSLWFAHNPLRATTTEDQMNLDRYFSVLRNGWKVIIALAVLGGVIMGIYSLISTPQYRATTTLFFYLSGGDSTTQLLQGSTYAQNQVRSFAILAEQPAVLDPVIRQLNLDTTSVQLSRQVTTNVPLDTVVMDVSVSDTSATEAAAIANAIGAQMSTAISSLTPSGDAAVKTASVRVSTIAPAQVPQSAYAPNTKLNVAIGLALGAILGVAVVVLRAVTNNRVSSLEDVRQLTNIPVVGDIPFNPDAESEPVVNPDANSSQADAYRRLAANYGFLDYEHSLRAIVVTSCLPNEGKSTSTLNLAVALSNKRRVIVVDADLRRPSIANLTGLNEGIGLSGVLAGQAPVVDVLQDWRRGQVQILTAGRIPPNPAELLDSDPLHRVLSELRNHCDLVILDTAPVLSASDAVLLSNSADGALVIVDAKRTKRHELQSGLENIALAGGDVLGLVLNKTSTKSASYYGQYKSESPTGNAGP